MVSRRKLLGMGAAFPLAISCKGGSREAGGAEATASSVAPPPVPAEARAVTRIVPATRTMEGAGVRLSRALGSRALSMADPFLMLDEIRSTDPRDYLAGFPEHPHRGFETVTIMMDGVIEHADSIGNRGLLRGGSIQWMTAGHGIIHSEMPQKSGGPFWGLQLWVNLPKRLKLTRPRYQDIAADRVPEVGAQKTRVLAGEHAGAKGPVEGVVVAPTVLDVSIASGETFTHELPVAHTAILYVLSGVALVGPERKAVAEHELAVLDRGAVVFAHASGGTARVLLMAASPIGEPVARRGPFVMNTEDELDRAFADYRSGRLVEG